LPVGGTASWGHRQLGPLPMGFANWALPNRRCPAGFASQALPLGAVPIGLCQSGIASWALSVEGMASQGHCQSGALPVKLG